MIEQEFPILQRGLYVNHAAMAPWPRSTYQAVKAFSLENLEQGPKHYAQWMLRETRLRQSLAAFIHAESEDDIALLKNTTEGLSLVAQGLSWSAGDNVVLPIGEFPSNDLPWASLEDKGVALRRVDIRNVEDPEQALLDAMDEQTRLLTVSAIQYSDGFRLNLVKLGNACKNRDVVFCVDAIQQLGALPLDVQTAHIDCLSADAHKWMLGPEGIAVFYCSQTMREHLKPMQYGWRMMDNPFQFDRDDWTPSSTARRYEAGSPNYLGQVAMAASLKVLMDQGMDHVAARLLENSKSLIDGLSSMSGVDVLTNSSAERLSGIVTFIATGNKTAGELYRVLQSMDVMAAVRGGGIRLSPHYYQSPQHMQQVLERIEQAING